MKYFLILLQLLVALLLTGCPGTEQNAPLTQFDESAYFRTITSKMTLTHSRVRGDYTIGKKGQYIKFLLKNVDVTPVSVDEWYMNEAANINLYYAFCEHGKANEVKEEDWKVAWSSASLLDSSPKRSRRTPLVLQPNNGTVMDVPLDFLMTLKTPRKMARYYIALYAQISLNTLKTKSDVFEITVYPKVVDMMVE